MGPVGSATAGWKKIVNARRGAVYYSHAYTDTAAACYFDWPRLSWGDGGVNPLPAYRSSAAAPGTAAALGPARLYDYNMTTTSATTTTATTTINPAGNATAAAAQVE